MTMLLFFSPPTFANNSSYSRNCSMEGNISYWNERLCLGRGSLWQFQCLASSLAVGFADGLFDQLDTRTQTQRKRIPQTSVIGDRDDWSHRSSHSGELWQVSLTALASVDCIYMLSSPSAFMHAQWHGPFRMCLFFQHWLFYSDADWRELITLGGRSHGEVNIRMQERLPVAVSIGYLGADLRGEFGSM